MTACFSQAQILFGTDFKNETDDNKRCLHLVWILKSYQGSNRNTTIFVLNAHCSLDVITEHTSGSIELFVIITFCPGKPRPGIPVSPIIPELPGSP